jgi:hypothetical protein
MSAIKLGRVWAATPASPNIDPGAEKYKLGWVAEIPLFQVLNYINNRYDTNIVSLAERGMFEWGSDVAYNIAALAWDEADGFIYVSKTAAPSTTDRPGLNPTQWDKSAVQISRKQYDDAVTAWNNHAANTSNPHALTVDILNTYSKAVIDGKVGAVQTALTNHTSNTANPHGTTAVQAGAVPVTGGSYTGLVKQLFESTGIGAASYAATLLANATGAFLTLGPNSKIGIDSSNVAVFVNDAGVKSPLLITSNYIAAREAVESLYVPPGPDLEVIFRNSLGLLSGIGSITFTGPAGSRGYLDKSGTAQTAGLNMPRYTAQGLYVTNSADTEALTVPTNLNGANASNFTYCLNFQSTPTLVYSLLVDTNSGAITSGIGCMGGNYIFRSVLGGVLTNLVIAPVDHSTNHKVVVVSNATLNKTFVYFDGVLKITVNTKQDNISNGKYFLSSNSSNYGAQYLNSFQVWLAALTAQQVFNI